jgi:hypothetical protein
VNEIKNISFFIIVSIILTYAGILLESDFLFVYLKENIIGLLLTLLAINTATLGLIASKIQDIVENHPEFDFSSTIKEMKTSLIEQLVLIGISVVALLLMDSGKIELTSKNDIGNVILTTVLIYSVNILWDTGKAVFIVIEELQKFNNREK